MKCRGKTMQTRIRQVEKLEPWYLMLSKAESRMKSKDDQTLAFRRVPVQVRALRNRLLGKKTSAWISAPAFAIQVNHGQRIGELTNNGLSKLCACQVDYYLEPKTGIIILMLSLKIEIFRPVWETSSPIGQMFMNLIMSKVTLFLLNLWIR